MRFIFGQGWVHFFDETDGGDGNGAAGGGAAKVEGEGVVDGGGEGDDVVDGGAAGGKAVDQVAEPAKKDEAPKDMKAAIDAALGYKKGPNGEELDPLTGQPKAPAAKPGEKKAAAGAPAGGAAKDTETHYANGKPKKDAEGRDLDDKGAVVKKEPAKLKTAAELDLKPEQKKLLAADTRIRFGELINTLKTHEGTITKQTEQIKNLSEGRDAILGLMEESRCTHDQLADYLYLNTLLTSDNPKDLKAALQFVERERADLYAKLGIEPEGGGLDLLKQFPDLAKQVEDEEITRAAALEIAHGRRTRAAAQAASERAAGVEKSKRDGAAATKKASDDALDAIDAWSAGLEKTDIDFAAKKDRLLAQVDGVIKEYQPAQWLATLKLLYQGIVIQKAPPGKGQQPLRPSGAKPGAPQPKDMKEAIDRGLGYAGNTGG